MERVETQLVSVFQSQVEIIFLKYFALINCVVGFLKSFQSQVEIIFLKYLLKENGY